MIRADNSNSNNNNSNDNNMQQWELAEMELRTTLKSDFHALTILDKTIPSLVTPPPDNNNNHNNENNMIVKPIAQKHMESTSSSYYPKPYPLPTPPPTCPSYPLPTPPPTCPLPPVPTTNNKTRGRPRRDSQSTRYNRPNIIVTKNTQPGPPRLTPPQISRNCNRNPFNTFTATATATKKIPNRCYFNNNDNLIIGTPSNEPKKVIKTLAVHTTKNLTCLKFNCFDNNNTTTTTSLSSSSSSMVKAKSKIRIQCLKDNQVYWPTGLQQLKFNNTRLDLASCCSAQVPTTGELSRVDGVDSPLLIQDFNQGLNCVTLEWAKGIHEEALLVVELVTDSILEEDVIMSDDK